MPKAKVTVLVRYSYFAMIRKNAGLFQTGSLVARLPLSPNVAESEKERQKLIDGLREIYPEETHTINIKVV